jgi:hypothetical protein
MPSCRLEMALNLETGTSEIVNRMMVAARKVGPGAAAACSARVSLQALSILGLRWQRHQQSRTADVAAVDVAAGVSLRWRTHLIRSAQLSSAVDRIMTPACHAIPSPPHVRRPVVQEHEVQPRESRLMLLAAPSLEGMPGHSTAHAHTTRASYDCLLLLVYAVRAAERRRRLCRVLQPLQHRCSGEGLI